MDKIELTKGQTVLLELEGECVIGEVLHIGSKGSFIRLKNVRDFQSNNPIAGNQDYYKSEIRNIKVVEDFDTASQVGEESRAGNSVVSSVCPESVIRINLEDVQEINDKIDDHIFIHQTDAKYHDAIRYLKTQKHLAVAMEEIAGGRHASSPSLLSIATPEQIYVFDIMWMGITNDMKVLLASPKIRRIVHNARLIGDVLKHRYGAPLGRCFDILVAHISTVSNYDEQREMSVHECLAKYLNLPNNFFDSSINFKNRPLNEGQRKAAAKNVAFLHTLEDHFIHEVMLEPFYRSSERYGASLARYDEHVDSIIQLSKPRNEDLHDVERFQLNIRNDVTGGDDDEGDSSTVLS
ncbi:protein Exd1 homolog [Uranotaenia lowii]|uniref:protein Exd1 homolog n=1 Tax=Uranotaenia lowii TaxID=190385 RepID=UPI00247AD3FD|nr:protein Exd1 homolog [Uranotaenia lowii]